MKSLFSYLSYVEKRTLAPLLVLGALLFPIAAFANDAPGSIPYQGASTRGTDHAAFNVFSGNGIPGNPGAGGEQNFLTAAPSGQTNWSDSVTACDGQMVDLSVYVHNGAEVHNNGQNNDGPGVAIGSRLKVAIPGGSANSHEPVATLSATNVPAITDDVTITCGNSKVTLEYVAGSAEIYSQFRGVDQLSDDVVGPNGTPIGTYADDGKIPGCWEFRVWVKLTVKVKKVEEPKPIFECKTLTALPAAVKPDEDVKFTATANAENGATITKYVFNFGDGNSQTVTSSAETASATHAYDDEGNYNANVTVHFTVNGQAKQDSGNKCKTTVKVDEKEKPVCPTDPSLPADSSKCDEEPETPPELPDTGIGSALAGFFGTSALFASAKELLNSRRQLRASALKR